MVKVINQELVVAINGPIMFFIPKENTDTNIWDIPEGYLNKTNKKKLIAGDFIKIQIIDKRINQNDSQIKAIGRLLNFASVDEVDLYYGAKIINDKIISDDIEVTKRVDSIETISDNDETDSNFIV
jgi:hypothetical protein